MDPIVSEKVSNILDMNVNPLRIDSIVWQIEELREITEFIKKWVK